MLLSRHKATEKMINKAIQQIDLHHFAQIVQQANDAIFSTDAAFTIKSWNLGAQNLYGFTPEEVIGKKLREVLESRLTEHERDKELSDLRENGLYKKEYEFKNKDGGIIHIHASITVLTDANGSISGYVAIHRDINELKKKEEKLTTASAFLEEQVKQKAAQLTSIFERITDAFVAIDSNFCYTYMNKKAGELFNRNPASMVGKHMWTEFPEGIGQQFYQACKHAIVTQQYTYVEQYSEFYNKFFENNIYPSSEGLSIFFRDITTNKQIEAQAKLSNQRLSLHLTHSPLAVIEWDIQGVITSWSEQAEAVFEWKRSEAIGRKIEDLNLVHAPDRNQVSEVIEALMRGSKTSLKLVNRNNTKTGKVIFCEWYNSVLKNDDGNVFSCMSLVQDITETKRAETELLEKNEQLRNLSAHLQDILEEERANIAREIHDELGERLTGIRLDISWIESHLSEACIKDRFPALIKLVDDTIKTVRKISTELRPSLLDDFGLVDAIEWQAAEFEKRTGISCKVKSFVRQNLTNKKIEITLFRIFQESLTNILRHAEASQISVQLLLAENTVELTIADDGVGMDFNMVKHKKTLGLMGMKERVLMVNGEYNITSNIGKGTTITVSVPIN
jgi:PAS domain S-box-containing protein